jgi:hypothetical protein
MLRQSGKTLFVATNSLVRLGGHNSAEARDRVCMWPACSTTFGPGFDLQTQPTAATS